jgi:hypothetical protein
MAFTNLSKEEKTRSLIYVTNHELSTDEIIQNKQLEMLQVLWKYYIQGCDYYPLLKVFKTDKYNTVYTFDWPKRMDLTDLDRLLSNFVYRNERYIEISTALLDELAKTPRPTIHQLTYANNFTKYSECWMVHDPNLHIKKFKDPIIH